MEQETDDCPEEQSYRKKNIKIELEEAEPPLTEYLGTKINVNRIKEEATVQFVRSEPDLSVKEEIMEEDWQDVDKQKCSQGAQTSAIVSSVNMPRDNAKVGDALGVKKEMTEIDIDPTVNWHGDTHCEIPQSNLSVARQVSEIKDDHSYQILKEEIFGDGNRGYRKQHKVKRENFNLSRTLQSLKLEVHKERLMTICRVHLMRLDVFQCGLCDAVYTENRSMLQHLQNVHGYNPHSSLFMKYVNMNKNQKHVEASKGKKMYRCDKCMKTLHCKRAFKTHCDDMHGTELYKCTECDKDYKCMRYLRSHISNVHSSRAHNYTCDYCQKSFWRKPTLRAHIIGFHGKRIHLCRICSKTFKCRDQLQQHNKRVHGNPQHKCEVCHRLFTTRPILKKHIKSAHGLDDWQYKLALRSQGVHGPRSVPTDMRAVAGTDMSAVVGSDIQHNVDTVKLESANAEFEHGSVVFQNNKVDSDDLIYI